MTRALRLGITPMVKGAPAGCAETVASGAKMANSIGIHRVSRRTGDIKRMEALQSYRG
jgi:hypothetical protein